MGSIEHQQKYEAYAQEYGIETLRKIILSRFTKERIQRALESGDEHLNTIPLVYWDRLSYSVKTFRVPVMRLNNNQWEETGEYMVASLADKVCLLKHVAKYHLDAE